MYVSIYIYICLFVTVAPPCVSRTPTRGTRNLPKQPFRSSTGKCQVCWLSLLVLQHLFLLDFWVSAAADLAVWHSGYPIFA